MEVMNRKFRCSCWSVLNTIRSIHVYENLTSVLYELPPNQFGVPIHMPINYTKCRQQFLNMIVLSLELCDVYTITVQPPNKGHLWNTNSVVVSFLERCPLLGGWKSIETIEKPIIWELEVSFVERSITLCHYLRGFTIDRRFYQTHQIYTLVHKHYSNNVFILILGLVR